MANKIIKIVYESGSPNETNRWIIVAELGKDNVKDIFQHHPECEGDKWYYDIRYFNGSFIRTFTAVNVYFAPEEEVPAPVETIPQAGDDLPF